MDFLHFYCMFLTVLLLGVVGYSVQRHFQQYFCYMVGVRFIVEETGVPGENHRSVASH